MSEIIGNITTESKLIPVEKYSVLQIDDGDGRGWLDFSTLREQWELDIAVRMVDNRGGINGHRVADYRIYQRGEPIYVHTPNRIKVSGVVFEKGDIHQVHRFDDVEDIEAGWVLCRTINTIEDAQVAFERCSRLRQDDDKRHWRVVTADGKVRMSQITPNGFRLSGILWQADPLKVSQGQDVYTDRYDRFAACIMEMATEWDEQVVPILNDLRAEERLREQVYVFLALSSR